MNPTSWVILAAIAALFVLMVVRLIKKGGCGCNCSSCASSCGGSKRKQPETCGCGASKSASSSCCGGGRGRESKSSCCRDRH